MVKDSGCALTVLTYTTFQFVNLRFDKLEISKNNFVEYCNICHNTLTLKI